MQANSSLRQAITEASHRVDETLKALPLDAGESREGDHGRVLIDSPLVVVFEVDVATRIVTVLRASVTEPRRR